MELIKQFLQRFSNITLPDDTVKRLFIEIIKKELNYQIDRKDIICRQNIIYLKAPVVVKSEIFMRRKKILAELAETIGAKTPQDIR